ncbi:UNKNOWN [Stylonychia lemnae]|uniref:Cupin-like domain-containing protein n=1 Tax=Stylonychia lemnae TaxID=5949 RepID=A0A078B957_STYLE|nr:UNKNOWN [Stylonychia lemnae]|eukprot:CDW89807.1 UNKNOWN [Stylonychia lemnae]
MAIPRNLVYVFLLAIIIAFAGMIYVIYSEKDLTSFIHSSSIEVQENIMVHPLFQQLQEQMQKLDEVPRLDFKDLSPKKFYKEYLTRNIPLVVENGCKQWPAFKKWGDMSYLEQSFGSQSLYIQRLERNDKSRIFQNYGMQIYNRRNTFEYFKNKTENDTDGGLVMYFFQNEMIVNRNLIHDIQKPNFLSKILRNRLTGMTMWAPFVRKPEYKDKERYVCVIKGSEQFRMVSPVYKHEIYSGVLEELDPEITPLNFFQRVNTTKFPLYERAKVLNIIVDEGDCLFVPAFYWVQSHTVAEEAILVNFEYESHSELANLLFKAIDHGILEDD